MALSGLGVFLTTLDEEYFSGHLVDFLPYSHLKGLHQTSAGYKEKRNAPKLGLAIYCVLA